MAAGRPRVLVVTGKGGVGKTTTAAAAAVSAARAGSRTLVLSADPAHSLGDALGVPLSGASSGAEPVEVEPFLHAAHVGGERLAAAWRPVEGYLRSVLDALGVDPLTGAELTRVPGEVEVAALIELDVQAHSGRWDLVVLDCAPTSETLRLLALPEALSRTLRRLLPRGGARLGLGPLAGAVAGVPLPANDVVEAVSEWHDRMVSVRDLLSGPRSSVRLVVTPEQVVIAEARRLWTALCLHGYAVAGLVVNRVLPQAVVSGLSPAGPGGTGTTDALGPFLESWYGRQALALAEIEASFAGTTIVTTPLRPTEPVGADALAALADGWGPQPDATGGPPLVIDPTPTGYVLSAHLPHVSAHEVSLRRQDGELVLDVGGHRRVVTLPSALQRCRVTDATVADGRLAVSFEPEEEVATHG